MVKSFIDSLYFAAHDFQSICINCGRRVLSQQATIIRGIFSPLFCGEGTGKRLTVTQFSGEGQEVLCTDQLSLYIMLRRVAGTGLW